KSYFKSRTEEMPLVEVSPGTFVPLRGSMETHDAITSQKRTISIECEKCTLHLVCVEGVDGVMCPTCRTISTVVREPMGGNGVRPRRRGSSVGSGGGIGLGVKEEEILRQRN
ncbi:MAG: hypothetical protein SGARI_003597, partial [Bacillariaceae sp.]